jgi:hypothetical protein
MSPSAAARLAMCVTTALSGLLISQEVAVAADPHADGGSTSTTRFQMLRFFSIRPQVELRRLPPQSGADENRGEDEGETARELRFGVDVHPVAEDLGGLLVTSTTGTLPVGVELPPGISLPNDIITSGGSLSSDGVGLSEGILPGDPLFRSAGLSPETLLPPSGLFPTGSLFQSNGLFPTGSLFPSSGLSGSLFPSSGLSGSLFPSSGLSGSLFPSSGLTGSLFPSGGLFPGNTFLSGGGLFSH